MFLSILSCNYGGGHNRVAEAIAEEWQAQTGGRVEVVDYFSRFVHPLFDAATKFSYVQSVRHAPVLYGLFYRLTGDVRPDSLVQRTINRMGMERLARYLEEERPDVVCAVHCTPAGTMSDLHAAGRTRVPCLTVVTDYVTHSQWTHPHVDRYCVPNALVRDGLIRRGIAPDRIVASGLPIVRKFQSALDRGVLMARMGLAPGVPAILVMAGAYAMMGGVLDVVQVLEQLPHRLQAIVVCGYDRRLEHRVRARAVRARHPFHVLGFAGNVEELMTVSDLLITKAGGITVSEALVKRLPMLIYRPIPGQEEGNTRFLLDQGAAVVARTPAELHATLDDLLVHPDRLATLRQASAGLARPEASRVVVAHLASLARGAAGTRSAEEPLGVPSPAS
jgi:processive 1,2-diacylglycerol beta-glucosyltransferase